MDKARKYEAEYKKEAVKLAKEVGWTIVNKVDK